MNLIKVGMSAAVLLPLGIAVAHWFWITNPMAVRSCKCSAGRARHGRLSKSRLVNGWQKMIDEA